ncbi:MAG: YceI family protein [Planctomycetota bacterium]|jgi:polyisoprenoid-binding protein YceI|nr:YceI family protein [Planctomycetota bacterium]
MIRSIAIAGLLLATTALSAATYKVDTGHSALIWGIQHLGLGNTYGVFKDFTGSITFDRANLAASSVNLTVQIASVDSNDKKRDDHLRNADFFDAGTFPEMTFVATGFTPVADNDKAWTVNGELTIRGVTKPVETTVHLIGEGTHPMAQKPAIGFETEFTIDRTAFGVGQGKVSGYVGKDVRVIVAMEAIAE